MTFRHDHVECDSCHAVLRATQARAWEAIAPGDGASAHLCPKCVRLRERGELASNPLDIRCDRCGRAPADGVKEWHIGRTENGEQLYCCPGCSEDEDAIFI